MDKKNKLLLIERIFDLIRFIVTIFVIISLVYIGVHFFRMGYDFVLKRNELKNMEIDITVEAGNEYEIKIPWGYNTDDIAAMLKEKGFIDNEFLFSIWAKFIGYEGKFTAGAHVVDKHENYNNLDGYEKLMYILSRNPKKEPDVKIMIPEGCTLLETEKILKENGIKIDDNFWDTVYNYDYDYKFLDSVKKDIKKRNDKFEGYMFPDTYIFAAKSSPDRVVEKLLSNFDRKFRDEFYDRAELMGITVDEAIIIASLIEKEAQLDSERETISGVIYNRLNSEDSSMKYLQIDATIEYYYIQTTGEVKPVLSQEDTRIDHPYNTYVNPGLPPGPICSPGLNSIIAALYPEEHDYYYYVAKGDGSHEFSTTYEEHLNAVNKYTKD